MTTSPSKPSPAELYLGERAIDRKLAERLGVRIEAAAIHFPGGRIRSLNGNTPKVAQPKGQPLEAWWPAGSPAPDAEVLVCEGESDALAALSTLERTPEPAGLRGTPVLSVPGTGFPVGLLAETLRAAGVRSAWLAFDADDAGRGYSDRASVALSKAEIGVRVVEIPEGSDLAESLAARSDRAEWLANLLADSELAPPAGSESAEESGRSLTVETAAELCALPDPPDGGELLGPLLVRGHRTVLGAHTGEGKTTFALQALGAVVDGTELLDWQGSGGRALVIDAEQGLRTIKRRLREANLADSDRIDFLRVPDGLRLDHDEADITEVERILRAGRYEVVVADPLYKLHAGDSNEERQAVDLMRRLDLWRSELGFALLLLSHRRKVQQGTRRFTLDDFFGSSAFLRGAEVVLGIHRVRPGYSRLHFFKDRDGDLPVGEAWGLLFDRESGFRRDPEDGTPTQSTADRVAELLVADPGLTLEQLKTATDRAERTIRDALSELGAESSGHPKRWRLPAGEQSELMT